MSIGLGVVLFVIGAILAFALHIDVGWIDLSLVGYILMGAGVVVFIIGIVLLARRRRTVATSHTTVDPRSGDTVRRDETSTPDDTV
jgi:protein-S-isoprenylcysteine O-methyltransferase Ste14